MKSTLVFVIAATFTLFVSCGEKNKEANLSVPQKVKNCFMADFSGKSDVSWEQEGDFYEAEYTENGIEISVLYDAKGKQISKETEISADALPVPVVDYITQHFSGVTIEEAEMLEDAEGTFYIVEIESDNQETELKFDQSGNYAGEETEADSEDDND